MTEPQSAAAQAPVLERVDPYRDWREKEDTRLQGGIYVRDMKQIEVSDWPRYGVKGALMYLDGDDSNDEHIIEIPPGKGTNPVHHMYDAAIYVVQGRGTASVWYDEKKKRMFEWGEGSFFVLPTNITYQFFNVSGTEPARFFAVTNLPETLRRWKSVDFIFNCPFEFNDRYSGADNYFSGEGKLYRRRLWETNFVPDVRKMKLWEWKERGGGGTNAFFALAGGTVNSHISRFQPGTYKKGHRHGSEAHLYIIQGEGYVRTQRVRPDGSFEEAIRCDWGEGSLYLSGAGQGIWHHQHFNVGHEPAAYLVLGVNPSRRYATSRWNADQRTDVSNGSDLSVEEGGRQVEYENEDPEVHRIFEAELNKRGVECRMRHLSPFCTSSADGPTQRGEWGDERVAGQIG
jgi:mannose-6-phosphate isomerase-like protein (cupin superfamily)